MKSITYLEDWAVPYFGACEYDLASSNVPFDTHPLPSGFEPDRWQDGNAWELLEEGKERVASLYDARPENVTLSLGASGGIFLTALACNDASAVVVESPVYEPLVSNYEAFGIQVRSLERRRDEGYLLEVAAGRAAELARQAALVVVTNPHNPSGQMDSREGLRRFAEAIAPAVLVVDEVYLPFVPGAESAWGVADNVCVINSMTKAWGLAFLRFGWVVAPDELARKVSSSSFYTPGIFPVASIAAGMSVLEDPVGAHERAMAHLEGRLDKVDERIQAHPRLGWLRPAGNLIIGSVELHGVEADRQFCREFMEKHDAALAPGSFFGEPGTIRLGIGAHADRFDEGFERLLQFAASYQPT